MMTMVMATMIREMNQMLVIIVMKILIMRMKMVMRKEDGDGYGGD